jgi:HK97 family phage major capsid protein
MNVIALRAKHGELMKELEAVVESTAADALDRFNAIEAEMADIRSKMDAAESIEGRRARAAAIRQEAGNTIVRPEMRGGNSAFDFAAFRSWMGRKDASPQGYDVADFRTLSTGVTTPFGGYTVPTIQTGEFVKWQDWSAPVRELATVLQFSQPYDLPVINGRTTVTATAEAALYTESEFTVDRRQFKAWKMTAETNLTDELLNDSVIDMAGEIIADHARAHVRAREQRHCVGLGAAQSQEQGLFSTGGSAYHTENVIRTGAANTDVDFDDIIKLYGAIRPAYQQNAVWIMNPATWVSLLQLRDSGGASGRYLYDGFTGNVVKDGATGILMGRPVYITEFAPKFTSGTAADFVFYGDLKRCYRIVDRTQVKFLYDPYTKSSNGIVMYKSDFRSDALIVDKYAGGVIRNAAAGA